MATVYLAQDLRHDREVAVKVLNPELAAVVGTERFLAEIRTTANLSHPHILPLHDSGEADGFLFYVMPYVKGETLRQRLDREGQLPVEEAVRIAGRVADALDHAHRQKVIHRDIKPANILFQDDEPVVADFGIALAVSAAGEGRLTETGLSLGTPYYMSPEQAAGEDTPSAASDVYSLGCVLYEMLTGDPPHTGSSAQAILGKILLGEVTRPTKLRRTIPTNVEAAILKALERLPADRFASTRDLAVALKDKGFRHGEGAAAGTAGAWKWMAFAATAVAVLLLGLVLRDALTPEPLPPVLRQEIQPPSESFGIELTGYVAVAPDGSSMAYRDNVGLESGWQLWIKERGSVDGRPLTGTEGFRGRLRYSPDGRSVAYKMGSDLIIHPIHGGGPQTLLGDGTLGQASIGWLDDGTILCEQPGGTLVRVHPDGGLPPDTILRSGPTIRSIHGLPGGKAALVVICPPGNCRTGGYLNVVDLQADTAWVEREEVMKAWYVPTGDVVWLRGDGGVFAAPFHLGRLEMGETDEPLFEGVRSNEMELTREGTALVVEGVPNPGSLYELVWVDREGGFQALDPSWRSDDYEGLALSPDDRRLAVVIQGEDYEEIWAGELLGRPSIPITAEEGRAWRPVWSHDMTTIAYTTNAGGNYQIRTVRSDGASLGESVTLLELPGGRDAHEIVYTPPDNGGAVFREGNTGAGEGDLGYLDLATGEVQDDLLPSEFNEKGIALSPDGRWLAYTSDFSGQDNVFVRPFPSVEDHLWPVSTNGGTEPVWAHNGRELFFRDGEGWMRVATYASDPTFEVLSLESLFDASSFRANTSWHFYDVDQDDQRFLMMRRVPPPPTPASPPRLILIQNFFTLIEERTGGR
jgi:serine/threonine-protein kinase